MRLNNFYFRLSEKTAWATISTLLDSEQSDLFMARAQDKPSNHII